MSDVLTNAVGMLWIEIGGTRYPCKAIDMLMEINKLPTANVVVGTGTLIETSTNSAVNTKIPIEKLLEIILGRKQGDYYRLIDCAIYEVTGNSEKKIFDGCVLSGSLVYSAGTQSSKAVHLMCVHKAGKLYTSPLSCYTLHSGADIQKVLAEQSLRNIELSTTDQWGTAILTYNAVYEKLKNSTNVLDILNVVVNQIIRAGRFDSSDKSSDKDYIDLHDYFICDYKLNEQVIAQNLINDFVESLIHSMFKAMQSTSIMEAILSALTSDTFMLMVIPRMGDKNFKLEIMPSAAWDESKYKVSGNSILGINAMYNAVQSLDTPDAFIVNFNPAISFGGMSAGVESASNVGVYSRNKELYDMLCSTYTGKAYGTNAAVDSSLYKYKIYYPPSWMFVSLFKSSKEDVEKYKTMDEPADKNAVVQVDVADITRAKDIADSIAKSLYVHMYGTADQASIQLAVSERFGMLERNIGNVVDISFPSNTGLTGIRGCLQNVKYTYTSGTTSNASYRISLNCVRAIGQETPIKSTLYIRG